jgi:ring-1,2-phenylacetyl-CoA epoxidase subunit PaaC
MTQELKECLLILADNSLILGQRLGEWCGHGPVLEQDIALTNISLDLIGEARYYYQLIAKAEGTKEDDYAMFRDVRDFKNVLLVEQPNGHWGDTIVRQFLFDCYHYHLLKALEQSNVESIAQIASKCVKEETHLIIYFHILENFLSLQMLKANALLLPFYLTYNYSKLNAYSKLMTFCQKQH